MPRLVALIIAVAWLPGCQSGGPCGISLSDGGWERSDSHPALLENDYNKEYTWFTNPNEDYLSCPTYGIRKTCSSTYEIHEKQDDGSYDYQEIVCTQ